MGSSSNVSSVSDVYRDRKRKRPVPRLECCGVDDISSDEDATPFKMIRLIRNNNLSEQALRSPENHMSKLGSIGTDKPPNEATKDSTVAESTECRFDTSREDIYNLSRLAKSTPAVLSQHSSKPLEFHISQWIDLDKLSSNGDEEDEVEYGEEYEDEGANNSVKDWLDKSTT